MLRNSAQSDVVAERDKDLYKIIVGASHNVNMQSKKPLVLLPKTATNAEVVSAMQGKLDARKEIKELSTIKKTPPAKPAPLAAPKPVTAPLAAPKPVAAPSVFNASKSTIVVPDFSKILLQANNPVRSFEPAQSRPVSFEPAQSRPVSFEPAQSRPVSFEPAPIVPAVKTYNHDDEDEQEEEEEEEKRRRHRRKKKHRRHEDEEGEVEPFQTQGLDVDPQNGMVEGMETSFDNKVEKETLPPPPFAAAVETSSFGVAEKVLKDGQVPPAEAQYEEPWVPPVEPEVVAVEDDLSQKDLSAKDLAQKDVSHSQKESQEEEKSSSERKKKKKHRHRHEEEEEEEAKEEHYGGSAYDHGYDQDEQKEKERQEQREREMLEMIANGENSKRQVVRSKEDPMYVLEKRGLLNELMQMSLKGIWLTREFTEDDEMEVIRAEYLYHLQNMDKEENIEGLKNNIKKGFMALDWGNKLFGPFLKLDGWSDEMGNAIECDEYKKPLERIYKKYLNRRGSSNPIWSLVIALVLSIVIKHMSNSGGMVGVMGQMGGTMMSNMVPGLGMKEAPPKTKYQGFKPPTLPGQPEPQRPMMGFKVPAVPAAVPKQQFVPPPQQFVPPPQQFVPPPQQFVPPQQQFVPPQQQFVPPQQQFVQQPQNQTPFYPTPQQNMQYQNQYNAPYQNQYFAGSGITENKQRPTMARPNLPFAVAAAQ
jgi:hypothetical protein